MIPVALRNLCKIVFTIFLAFFLVKIAAYHYALISYPYPNEYREGVLMTTTDALLRGINPFALENQPAYTNDYGIGLPVVTLPFAKIFGPTLLVHRLVSGFFILASCGILFAVMRAMAIPFLLSAFAVIFFYGCQLYPGTTTACANAAPLGLTLFLLAVFIPWKYRYSYGSLLISILLTIAAYYTKAYYLLGAPIVGSYLFFFVSKKKGLAFTAGFFLLFTLSIVLMLHFFPYYFVNCFFIHDNIRCVSWEHAFKEFQDLTRLHHWILVLLAGVAGGSAVKAVVQKFPLIRICRDALGKIRLNAFDKPLWDIPMPIALYSGLFCFLVFVLFLSKHEAASLWYFFHLVTPFLVIGIAWLAAQFHFWPFVLAPLLILSLMTLTRGNTTERFRNIGDWKTAMQLITTHHDILNTPVIAPFLVEQNKPIYDNGISEYFKTGAFRYNKLTRKFFKSSPEVLVRHMAFIKEIGTKIERQGFDLAMLRLGDAPLTPNNLQEHYTMVGILDLPAPHAGGAKVTVWVPKRRN